MALRKVEDTSHSHLAVHQSHYYLPCHCYDGWIMAPSTLIHCHSIKTEAPLFYNYMLTYASLGSIISHFQYLKWSNIHYEKLETYIHAIQNIYSSIRCESVIASCLRFYADVMKDFCPTKLIWLIDILTMIDLKEKKTQQNNLLHCGLTVQPKTTYVQLMINRER